MMNVSIALRRTPIVIEPNGDPREAEGIFNPACARARDGALLLYPRVVASGNISRVGIIEVGGTTEAPLFTRAGFALEPRMPYELRSQSGGYGCEDPRVTFMPVLDAYLMAYAAYGPQGPRIAFAISRDGYAWERLGLATFAPGLPGTDDKDAAFFPEPVLSPRGVWSIALYHRPMTWTAPPVHPCTAAPAVLAVSPRERECVRIGYIPLDPVLRDRRRLLTIAESVVVLDPGEEWGRIKIGAGTPPVRMDAGWFSLYHAVDVVMEGERCTGVMYYVGAVVHDLQRPDIVRYRSPQPLLLPQAEEERHGIVDNVVFPTAIDARPGGERAYDVYYGMGDLRTGCLRLTVTC